MLISKDKESKDTSNLPGHHLDHEILGLLAIQKKSTRKLTFPSEKTWYKTYTNSQPENQIRRQKKDIQNASLRNENVLKHQN